MSDPTVSYDEFSIEDALKILEERVENGVRGVIVMTVNDVEEDEVEFTSVIAGCVTTGELYSMFSGLQDFVEIVPSEEVH